MEREIRRCGIRSHAGEGDEFVIVDWRVLANSKVLCKLVKQWDPPMEPQAAHDTMQLI